MNTLAPITHFIPAASFQRERLLLADGRINARRGQQVNPGDVVAESTLRPEHIMLDISKGLGLGPKEADQYIQRRAGDEVGEGDVIAGPVGIGRRVVRAPKSGTVVMAGGGQILMELVGQHNELKAGYPGVVADIIGDRGVVIESIGSLVQAVWGNGKINYGLLNPLAHTPDELLTHAMLDVSLRGSVLMSGCCTDEQVLTVCDELPVRGLILASMDSTLVACALKMNYPIVLVEGFGRLPMNQAAFDIFTSGAMRETAVIAEPWDRMLNTRPEVVINLPEGVNPEILNDSLPFTVGQTVRVISSPYKSLVGSLTTLQPGLSVLPSGLRAPTASVRLLNGDTVQIPLANLEVIA